MLRQRSITRTPRSMRTIAPAISNDARRILAQYSVAILPTNLAHGSHPLGLLVSETPVALLPHADGQIWHERYHGDSSWL
jgi:hypothetical protein